MGAPGRTTPILLAAVAGLLFAACLRVGGGAPLCLPGGKPPEDRVNLVVGGIEMPVGFHVLDWDSSWLENYVAMILTEEVLGFNSTVSAKSGTGAAGLHALAGCRDHANFRTDPQCYSNATVFRHHVLLELWGLSRITAMRERLAHVPHLIPEGAGSLGYDGVDGMYVFKEQKDQAYISEGLPLEYYKSFDAAWHRTWAYFDNWTAFDPSELRPCSDTRLMDTLEVRNYLRTTGDAEGVTSTPAGLVARCWNNSWWLSPACRNAPETCVPSITGDTGWGVHDFMQKATYHNMPVALAVAKTWALWRKSARTVKGLPYWWQPDSSLIDFAPTLVAFPPFNAQERASGSLVSAADKTPLSKWIYSGLRGVAGRLRTFFLRLSISLGDIEEMLLDNLVNASDGHRAVACRWVQKNSHVWKSWIPDSTACIAGQGLVDASGAFVAERSNASSCDWCPEGMHSAQHTDGGGETYVCLECAAGTFQPKPGQMECLECELGMHAANNGSRECSRCDVGTYQDETARSNCKACPAPSTTMFRSAAAVSDCVCPAGMVALASGGQLCVDCPPGMVCSTPNSSEAAIPGAGAPAGGEPFPEAAPGFMTRLAAPLRPYRCKTQAWCPGGRPGTCARNRDPSQVACGKCLPDMYEGQDGSCHACSGSEGTVLVIFSIVAGSGVLCFMAYAVNRNVLLQTHATTTCIIILGLTFTGIQSIGAFNNLAVKWIEPLKAIFSTMSLLSFDMKLLRVECLVGSSPVLNYSCRQLVAPASALLIAAILAAKRRFIDPGLAYGVELVNTVGAFYQLFFISIILSATVPFVCYRHPGGAGFSLASSPSVLCGEDGSHTAMMIVGCCACVTVPLPFIAIVAYGTAMYPRMLGDSQARSGEKLRMFRFLFFRYQPAAYYFGVVTLMRGLLVCLVPVVIRDHTAVQIVAMSSVLLAFSAAQMMVQPWRSQAANATDGAVSNLMVLLLVCVAISTEGSATEETVGVLATVVFAVLVAGLLCMLAHAAYRRLRPTPYYDWFVCHHKADAGAQARFLQMLLRQRTGQTVFLDSDNLTNLDELFDIVRCRVGRLVAYLTCDTLRRPWCAGEITVTHQTHKRLVMVRAPSFTPPTAQQIQDIGSYVDLSSMSLLEYGVTMDMVSGAFAWLEGLRCLDLRRELPGRRRFDSVVASLLERAHPEEAAAEKVEAGCVVLSSDPFDDEATAAAGILAGKIQEAVMGFVTAGLCVLADRGRDTAEALREAIFHARAVLVVLTGRSTESPQQLQVIADSMAVLEGASEAGTDFEVIPVSTPSFRFPTERYYKEVLPDLFPQHAVEMHAAVQNFFKRISVDLATSASDQVLSAQALEVVARIPRGKSMSTAHSQRHLQGEGIPNVRATTSQSDNLPTNLVFVEENV